MEEKLDKNSQPPLVETTSDKEDRKADAKSIVAATHDTNEAPPEAPPHFDPSTARETTRG